MQLNPAGKKIYCVRWKICNKRT